MPVMRAMLLLEEQMKEKRHSMGSSCRSRTPGDQKGREMRNHLLLVVSSSYPQILDSKGDPRGMRDSIVKDSNAGALILCSIL